MITIAWALLFYNVASLTLPLYDQPGLAIRQLPPDNTLESEDPSSEDDHPMVDQMDYHADYVTCNEAWYGHPAVNDCFDALTQLPYFFANEDTYREFLGLMGPHPRPASGIEGPRIQTPIVKNSGTCTVVVFLPSNVDTTRNVIVNLQEMNQAATWLADKCPGEEGKGGRFYHSPSSRAQYQAVNDHQLPEIVLFGRDSLAQSILDRQWSCSKNAKGDVKCRFRPSRTNPSSKDPKPVPRPVPVASKVGQRPSCFGSCLDQSECDINSNCICASDRGFGTLLSSHLPAWGSHACTYVVTTAFATTQAKGRGGTCFNRRCLLESDGTLDIAASGDASGSNLNETAELSPFTNMTNSEIENLIDKYEALSNFSSISNSSATFNDASLGPVNDSIPMDLTSDSSSPSPYEPVPIPQLDPNGHILPDPGSSILECPCNCTYVSAACCLTDMVWEDSSEQVHMGPLPANATVTCDVSTGVWLPRIVSGGGPASSTVLGFDNLGSSVPYIPPDVAAPYLPSTTGG